MQPLSLLALLVLGASTDTSIVVSAFGPTPSNKIGMRRTWATRTGTGTSTSTSNSNKPSSTTLYLEDHIAELIDGELIRIGKLKEWEVEFTAKNKQYLEPLSNPEATDSLLSQELGGSGGGSPASDSINPMQLRRDKKLAAKDPQQYCADRCVATGNCEVYEDIYHMSPSRVMEFCTGCVLAEDDDAECPVDMLYDDEDDTSDLRTNGQLRP